MLQKLIAARRHAHALGDAASPAGSVVDSPAQQVLMDGKAQKHGRQVMVLKPAIPLPVQQPRAAVLAANQNGNFGSSNTAAAAAAKASCKPQSSEACCKPRNNKPSAGEWRIRHMDKEAVDDGLAGCVFSDGMAVTNQPHVCTNLQANGDSCHVGLYGRDHCVARKTFADLRRGFLCLNRNEKAAMIWASMAVPLDGAGVGGAEPTEITVQLVAQISFNTGIEVLAIEEDSYFSLSVTSVSKSAWNQNVRVGDVITSFSGIECPTSQGTYQLTANAAEVVLHILRPDPGVSRSLVFKIAPDGRRPVCLCVFQHRFPVSTATLFRLKHDKGQLNATTPYELRVLSRKTQPAESLRGVRGEIAVAWILAFAAYHSDEMPEGKDVVLLPFQPFNVRFRRAVARALARV